MDFIDPGRVWSIDGSMARITTDQGMTDASLFTMEADRRPVHVGDWVLVVLGLVVDIVDEADGRSKQGRS